MAKTRSTIEGFAEDLGNLLGTATAKAEGWLNQRQQIAKTLSGIRDTANNLLEQLTKGAAAGRRRGRPAGSGTRGPGRPKGSGKKKRTMSAAARRAISRAQKARWAKQKAAEAKKK